MDNEEPVNRLKIKHVPDGESIELRNVSFQYGGPYSEKVLKNINLVIPSNKITAIVGTSGSGKTTLLKLLLKFYSPSEGQILLGQQLLDDFSDSAWRKKCGAVMQEGKIFSDTILNNIVVANENQDKKRLLNAMNIANISSFINDLPLKLGTKIGDEGIGLSTGQKQRLLISRIVYKDAKYLFFDEATNSLDATNEKNIMKNLSGFFIDKTVIIVAHRLSTVKNADNIIVLEKGCIVEEGNHDFLVNQKGVYYKLIQDQLELGV